MIRPGQQGRAAGEYLLRLRADIVVSAYMRHLAQQDLACYLVRRGHESAGQIFIALTVSTEQAVLFATVPQGMAAEGETVQIADRRFQPILRGTPAQINLRLDREYHFDSDLWVIEIENPHAVLPPL